MYYGGKLNGVDFYTQPSGAFGPVFPATPNGEPFTDWPVIGIVVSAYQPWFSPGCLHAIKQWRMIQEYDYNTNESVELCTCFICSYVQSAHFRPASTWFDEPLLYPIIIG